MKKRWINKIFDAFGFGIFFCILTGFGFYFMIGAFNSGSVSGSSASQGGPALIFLSGIILFFGGNAVAASLLRHFRSNWFAIISYILAEQASILLAVTFAR